MKILKMTAILALICAAVGLLTQTVRKNSISLQDYAQANPEIAYKESTKTQETNGTEAEENGPTNAKESSQTDAGESGPTDATKTSAAVTQESVLVGATLNSDIPKDQRTLYTDGFYYEPLSDNLRRYITGISYPENETDPVISYDDLRYVHIWHYDFDGNPREGELICNEYIAQDLVEIFYELYRNEYQLEQVLLIEEYDGDDTASMEANNTSCFNYRVVEGNTSLSKHAYGLAIDVNPLYNPYITYRQDGSQEVSPVSAQPYADRQSSFPYKIDENDLCYKLFIRHGFTWGGAWNSCKDYQHFQKAAE